MAIGKASFNEGQLLANYEAVMEEILRAKPSSAKGKYIVSATLATTMGPGIRVDSGKSADRETAASGGEEAAPAADETAQEPATV
jgi:large subunit ribosomal protein L1